MALWTSKLMGLGPQWDMIVPGAEQQDLGDAYLML